MLELFYAIVFSIVCWSGCESELTKPALYYTAPFDPALVDEVEAFMKELAEKRGFEVFEHDREQMKFVSSGQEALFIAFYAGEERNIDQYVLDITNLGTVFILALFEKENMPLSELERLSQEVRHGLKKELGIDFKVAEP